MSGWLIWLIVVVGNLSFATTLCWFILLIAILITTAIGLVGLALGAGCGPEDRDLLIGKAAFRIIPRFIFPFVLCLIVSTLCPTTKEAAAIYVLPKIVDKAQESELPEQLENLAIEWCKQQVKELTEKTKE